MEKRTIVLILLFLLIGFSLIYINNQGGWQQSADQLEEVELFFSTKDAMYLQGELRKIAASESTKYEKTISELIKGPESNDLNATIPSGVQLLDLTITDKIAYLSFNKALVDNHWGGSTGEIMTVYSIVNTITQFPEIDAAKILIEGEEIQTLAGHLDVSMVMEADEDLIKR